MTTCITGGFFKGKKYAVANYACDGSDLPATQDFGTVHYQGPSSTILTVPTTTVTYTIIGKASCGNSVKDIRRITTKTYSLRGPYTNTIQVTTTYPAIDGISVSPQVIGLPEATNNKPMTVVVTRTPAVGDVVIDLYTYHSAFVYPWPCPDSELNGGYFPYTSFSYSSLTKKVLRTDHSIPEYPSCPVPPGTYGFAPYIFTNNQYEVADFSAVTSYFLDIHEVWTYDIV